ncbi:MAG: tetratricopeptide repeat protein [Cyclobacteriaceae bacterium]
MRIFLIFSWVVLIGCSQQYNEVVQVGSSAEEVLDNPTFVGTQTCQSCHEQEFTDWQDSHHDKAMQVATASSVLGDFSDVIFTHKGVSTRFYRDGDQFMVNARSKDGSYQDYQVAYTFGVEPLQQYLIEFPNGAYQCLMVAWDTEINQWFQLQDTLDIAPEEWLHWTGGAMTWNTMCADCHSTELKKNYNSLSGSFQTQFEEINVGCEGCHGPSSDHVNFYNQEKPSGKPPVLYMNKSLGSTELVQKCARCHSRRSQLTKVFDYEGDYLDHYDPSMLVHPVYEADGQIQDEDYVFASFAQSKMYHNGVSCKDCHNVHSLELKAEGNKLCMSCHEPRYDSREHHFHAIDTESSKCVNCHMTGRTYMGNDFRRDHSFRIPRPDQSVKFGTSNACTGCHSDKSNKWAAETVVRWYGPERKDHFSDHLLAGYHGDPEALEKLMSGEQYPEIARATAISYYTDQLLTPEQVDQIKNFLSNPKPMIRNEAVRGLDKIGANFSEYLPELLMDSIRLIRTSTARYMIMNGLGQGEGFPKAESEYLDALDMNADFPSGQQNIALYRQSQGDIGGAISAYQKAIEMDNYANQARMNLALLLYQQGSQQEAEQLYLKVTKQEPDYGYAYYMLGLLYNEIQDAERAVEYLGLACEKDPQNIRAFYNFALILQQTDDNERSLEIIEQAIETAGQNEQLLYVKLLGQMNLEDYDSAGLTCALLMRLAPQNQDYAQIMQMIRGKLAG